jgi:hypothetical protein
MTSSYRRIARALGPKSPRFGRVRPFPLSATRPAFSDLHVSLALIRYSPLITITPSTFTLCSSCLPVVTGPLLAPALGASHSKRRAFLHSPFTLRVAQLSPIGCSLFHSVNLCAVLPPACLAVPSLTHLPVISNATYKSPPLPALITAPVVGSVEELVLSCVIVSLVSALVALCMPLWLFMVLRTYTPSFSLSFPLSSRLGSEFLRYGSLLYINTRFLTLIAIICFPSKLA